MNESFVTACHAEKLKLLLYLHITTISLYRSLKLENWESPEVALLKVRHSIAHITVSSPKR